MTAVLGHPVHDPPPRVSLLLLKRGPQPSDSEHTITKRRSGNDLHSQQGSRAPGIRLLMTNLNFDPRTLRCHGRMDGWMDGSEVASNVTLDGLTFLLHNREVPGSNLGLTIGYPVICKVLQNTSKQTLERFP